MWNTFCDSLISLSGYPKLLFIFWVTMILWTAIFIENLKIFTMRRARNSLLQCLGYMRVNIDDINVQHKETVRHQEPMTVGFPIQTWVFMYTHTHTHNSLLSDTFWTLTSFYMPPILPYVSIIFWISLFPERIEEKQHGEII